MKLIFILQKSKTFLSNRVKKNSFIDREYSKQNSIQNSNQQKMLPLSRPHSTLIRPLTAIPRQLADDQPNDVPTQRNKRDVLIKLIPDMPAFIKKNKSSTALLYSKFIVKGIKTNKIDLVRESFNMKKENLKYDKKMSAKPMKTIKSTRESVNKETLKSTQNGTSSKVEFLQKSMLNGDDSNMLNLEINNFFRINSNIKPLQENQTERKLSNVQSEKGFQKRPQSAFLTPHKAVHNTRAQTANLRNFPNSSKRENLLESDEFRPVIPERNLLTIIEAQRPGFRYTNFLQRNKRELSTASNKKTSIYLTGIDGNKNEKEIRKMSAKKHAIKKSMPDLSELNEFARNENLLPQKEIQEINEKNKQNAEFMKKHMPQQYKKFVQYMAIQESSDQKCDGNQLLSVNLQQTNNEFGQMNIKQKNQEKTLLQANNFFKDYAHICEETEYHINRHLKQKEIEEKFSYVLNVGDCQELIGLERERRDLEAGMTEKSIKRIKEIKQQMFSIVKMLSFFRSKSAQVCYKIFSLPFTIQSHEQDSNLIHVNDPINRFYIILNGSVVRQSRNQPSSQFQTLLTDPITTQTYTKTLFDGQFFGEPDNHSEQTHKHEYKAAEKLLVMTLPYVDYKKISSESQNIEERIQLLKGIFGNVPGCKSLNDEHLEAIAFELQSSKYDANTIIFRQEDICDKLIIVASGQISKINEHILKRAKKNSKDMRKKNKSATKLKLKNHSIEKIRRNNLKNYEVLNQNEEEFIFYYQDVAKEFIRGDVMNWEGFSYNYKRALMEQEDFWDQKDEFLTSNNRLASQQFKLPYSLISSTDNTKIYTFTMNKIQNLPEMLKQVICTRIDNELKKQKQPVKTKLQKLTESKPTTSIDKWDQYKQKICSDIISRKLKL